MVGCGRWGVNLARTFAGFGALRAVVDIEPATATAASERFDVPAVDLEAALADPAVAALAIATPAGSHFALAHQAITAGRHVLVEKPMALAVSDAEELCGLAERRARVLMVGHVLRYHTAFVALQALVRQGVLGRLRYLYSNRLNLGRIRREEDVLWSFAPHDVSMILALVGSEPERVSAVGGAYLDAAIADVTTTHLCFPGGEQAHVFVSWLHPFKDQKLVVVGDEAMAVFNDGRDWASKLVVFRHRISWPNGLPEAVRADAEPVPLERCEPLEVECRHFLDCISTGQVPCTDGREGLRVLRVLEAARSRLRVERPGVFIHESAYVDEPVEIGTGTRVWHFSHLFAGAKVGRNCTIGQNVMIGPDVTVGDGCKIQNNVSLYRGVTVEDGVFCGPSCVFTNVVTPRAHIDQREAFQPTRVGRGATVGANATVVCGHDIGPWSFVAAGAVVTTDVPAHALVAGVPARRIGWVSHDGHRLGEDLVCPRSGRRYVLVEPDRLEEING